MPLRPLASGDLHLVLNWRNSPNVRANMYTHHEITIEEHQAWFKALQSNKSALWFIYLDLEGNPQGVVYFTDYSKGRSAFWGLYAGGSAPRGNGLRMEYEALEMAFTELGLHKLNCEVLSHNTPIISLHRKFGFVEEGLFRDFHFDGERYVDVVRLGILAAEWARKKPEILVRLTKALGGSRGNENSADDQ